MNQVHTAAPSVRARTRTGDRPFRCGEWDCVRLLGEGRWTKVWRARPADCGEGHPADYVLKMLDGEFASDDVARAALAREAFVAAQIDHPHLGTVLAAHVEIEPHYLVLPFCEGATVQRILARLADAEPDYRGRQPQMPLPHVLWVIRQAAEGLSHLHSRGWLHGDLKPGNLIVAPQGNTVILDFGLARRLGDEAECRTDETWAGTLEYAAPETFLAGHQLTAATDIYSLGIVLFEMLSGAPPFFEGEPEDVINAHLEAPLPEFRTARPDIPPTLTPLLKRMTAKEPLRRPDADELIVKLRLLEIETLGER